MLCPALLCSFTLCYLCYDNPPSIIQHTISPYNSKTIHPSLSQNTQPLPTPILPPRTTSPTIPIPIPSPLHPPIPPLLNARTLQHPNPPLKIKLATRHIMTRRRRGSLLDEFQDSVFDVRDVEVVDGDVVVFEGARGEDIEFVVEGELLDLWWRVSIFGSCRDEQCQKGKEVRTQPLATLHSLPRPAQASRSLFRNSLLCTVRYCMLGQL